MNSDRRPILVSGSHRSGSTWLGRMIDLSADVGYIHEPFNRASGLSAAIFTEWFTYVCTENEKRYREPLHRLLQFQYPLGRKLAEADSIRDYGRTVRDLSLFTAHRLMNRRPLMKDPISIFSAEWLQETFNMQPVILVRHPAAFVGSIKKAEWRSGMKNFLNQPLLMRDHLAPFKEEILEHRREQKDLVEEGILLWNMIHHAIAGFRERHPDWFFIRHEDLSRKPVERFGEIYCYLELDYTNKILQTVRSFSTERDKDDDLKRDSRSNIWSWKRRLTDEEIGRVRKGTALIASQFYSDDEW